MYLFMIHIMKSGKGNIYEKRKICGNSFFGDDNAVDMFFHVPWSRGYEYMEAVDGVC